MPNKKTLEISDLVMVIDTREQLPLELKPFKTIRGTLKTGDYSVIGYEDKISIERKTLQDMIGCCGHGRERFTREMHRMQELEATAIVIEGNWASVDLNQYRGQMTPKQIRGAILGFSLFAKCAVHWADNRQQSDELVTQLLWISASRLHRRADCVTSPT